MTVRVTSVFESRARKRSAASDFREPYAFGVASQDHSRQFRFETREVAESARLDAIAILQERNLDVVLLP